MVPFVIPLKKSEDIKKEEKSADFKRQKQNELRTEKLKITFFFLHLLFRTTLGCLICSFHVEISIQSQSCFTKGFNVNYTTNFDGEIFVETV